MGVKVKCDMGIRLDSTNCFGVGGASEFPRFRAPSGRAFHPRSFDIPGPHSAVTAPPDPQSSDSPLNATTPVWPIDAASQPLVPALRERNQHRPIESTRTPLAVAVSDH